MYGKLLFNPLRVSKKEKNISDLSPWLSIIYKRHDDKSKNKSSKIHGIAKEIASTYFNLSLTLF